MDIATYFYDVVAQHRERLADYFAPNARVLWHNTNECFTVKEFICANCEYPGCWEGKIEQLLPVQDGWVLAARVWEKGKKLSFHVVSFVKIEGEKIIQIDEYWGDDGLPPQWRMDKKIGTTIHQEH